jgi:hypothetical protein
MCLVVVVACGGRGNSPGAFVERLDDARVQISVRYESTSESAGILIADFAPTAAGIHLYGVDLPKAGIDGAGRPTQLAVVDTAWRSTGPLTASVSSQPAVLPGFDQPFPLYPDGPVTLRQAVERTGPSDDGSIDATVTFMACTSSGLCFVPVEDHPVAVPSR